MSQLNAGIGNVTSVQANTVTTTGAVEGDSIVKTGGTSSQFLKADGSVDSTTYATLETIIRPGTVIEQLASSCDGDAVTVLSGTYNVANVTANQSLTSSYTVANGSEIAYTPPAGTTRVYYRYAFKMDVNENSGITHYRFEIDATSVTRAFRTYSSNYASSNWHHAGLHVTMEYVIKIGTGSTNASEAEFQTWTSPKTLRVRGREYNNSYETILHKNEWTDGSGTDTPCRPTLTITAIA